MTSIFKASLIAIPALTLIWLPTDASAQSGLRERVAAAVQNVRSACAADIGKFCGNVTPGEGRVMLCMQAHDDQLSQGCGFALYSASRNLERALERVSRIADACWNDIQAQCGDADRIGQCVMTKASSFSQGCQGTIAAVREATGEPTGTQGQGQGQGQDAR
jgi:hypothetical protein